MNNYTLFTDSCCDLTAEQLKEIDVKALSLEVIIDDKAPVYQDKINIEEFYATLRQKGSVTTSAVTFERFLEAFEESLKEGKDILYLGFSSGLSGTYNAAFVAAQELAEKYPERKVYTVDSLCASLGQGLFVYLAAKMRLEGKSIDELYEWAKEKRFNVCHWFTVDDLFFLKRGGRVSAASAVLGTMLGIKPVMHVNNEGKLIKVGVARGRKASLSALADRLVETILPDSPVWISHGDCEEDAKLLAEIIKEKSGREVTLITDVGPVIGAHSGPGTMALFFLASQR